MGTRFPDGGSSLVDVTQLEGSQVDSSSGPTPDDTVPLVRRQPVYDSARPSIDTGLPWAPTEDASVGAAIPTEKDAGIFGTSRCKNSNLLFCEDFESGSLDESVWMKSGSGMSVDATHAARGRYAAHARIANGGGVTNIYETKTFPAKSDTLYVRAFVYIDKFVSDPHTDLLQLQGKLNGDARWIGVSNMARYWDISYYAPNTANIDYWRYDKPNVVPVDKWQCIEWEYSGTNRKLHVWKDETEMSALAIDGSSSNGEEWGTSELNRLSFGIFAWHQLQADVPELNVWYDEIAVDGARIGCTR